MLKSNRSLLIRIRFARTVGLKAGDDLMLVNPSFRGNRRGMCLRAVCAGRGAALLPPP